MVMRLSCHCLFISMSISVAPDTETDLPVVTYPAFTGVTKGVNDGSQHVSAPFQSGLGLMAAGLGGTARRYVQYES
jgi:hypothetical protein